MHVTLVHVHVKSENSDDFIAATRRNHEASIREAGNRRFDILHSVLHEAYASADEARAHKETEHYRAGLARNSSRLDGRATPGGAVSRPHAQRLNHAF